MRGTVNGNIPPLRVNVGSGPVFVDGDIKGILTGARPFVRTVCPVVLKSTFEDASNPKGCEAMSDGCPGWVSMKSWTYISEQEIRDLVKDLTGAESLPSRILNDDIPYLSSETRACYPGLMAWVLVDNPNRYSYMTNTMGEAFAKCAKRARMELITVINLVTEHGPSVFDDEDVYCMYCGYRLPSKAGRYPDYCPKCGSPTREMILPDEGVF